MIRARGHAAIGTKVINRHSTSDRDARNDRGARPLAGFDGVVRMELAEIFSPEGTTPAPALTPRGRAADDIVGHGFPSALKGPTCRRHSENLVQNLTPAAAAALNL